MFTEQDKQDLLKCIDVAVRQSGLNGAARLLDLASKVQAIDTKPTVVPMDGKQEKAAE